MEFAEKMCGCRPWDYPTPDQTNWTETSDKFRICDFFGSSCFNMALEKNLAPHCKNKCMPDCDETSYSISIDKQPIDPHMTICDPLETPNTVLELQIKNYIQSQYPFTKWPEYHEYESDSAPEQRLLNLMKDILLKRNVSRARSSFREDCTAKIKTDIAAVIVSIDSPKFARMIKSAKVTLSDKLATLGKI